MIFFVQTHKVWIPRYPKSGDRCLMHLAITCGHWGLWWGGAWRYCFWAANGMCYIQIHTHAYTYIFMHMHKYADILMHIHTYKTYLCIHIQTLMHMHTHTYIFMHMHTFTYIFRQRFRHGHTQCGDRSWHKHFFITLQRQSACSQATHRHGAGQWGWFTW